MSQRIKQALSSAVVTTAYPRSQIDIYLQVIESDGADWSACINAAGLALVDAGINLKDMVAACEAAIIEDDSGPLIDPNHVESSQSSVPQLSVAILPKLDKIISMEVSGRLHLDRLESGLIAAKNGAKLMFEQFDEVVKKRLSDMNNMQT